MAERRGLNVVATLALLAAALSLMAVYALLPISWQASDPEGGLTTITLLNPLISPALFYATTLISLVMVVAAVIARWRPLIRFPRPTAALVVLAWFTANAVHEVNNLGPWTEHGRVTVANQPYVFLDSSFLQGQTMAIGRRLSSGLLTTQYRVLVTNNGDWPRSWASVIRPAKAVDRYGQLYVTANQLLVGIRANNRCYLAFELPTGRAIGHGDIESLSPFVCLTENSPLHTPDIAAAVNSINQVIDFCRRDQDIRHADGFLSGETFSGCPTLGVIEQGLTHKNPQVVAAAQQMLAAYHRGIATLTERIETEVNKRLPLLRDPNVQLRRAAALALGSIAAPAADSAIPELLYAVNNDEDRDVRLYALQSLGFFGDAAVTSITKLLRSSDSTIRAQAISALHQAGEVADNPAIAAQIEAALQDDDPHVRSSAKRFLDQHSNKNQ